MPRQRRLDIPGTVYHVIARGIERRAIFNDNQDRREFLRRLGEGLVKTQSRCHAWALMPNHFHLLLIPTDQPLSRLLQKVLTGYAVYFNHRYKRCGHLFQNRYKSILCQEDAYLLELVRYIHLNPLRAGKVKTLGELEDYPWCGHAVLMGKHQITWQETENVLGRFDLVLKPARIKYLAYMAEGMARGRREDLTGGGLVRSAGGWKQVAELKKRKETWCGDERILGGSDFVEAILKKAEEKIERQIILKRQSWNIREMLNEVCRIYGITEQDLHRKWRVHRAAAAKSVVAYLCVREFGMKSREIGDLLGLSRTAAVRACGRGAEIMRDKELKELSCQCTNVP